MDWGWTPEACALKAQVSGHVGKRQSSSCHGVKFLEQQLEASASSGRSGAMGETIGRATGHARGYNTGSGAAGYYYK